MIRVQVTQLYVRVVREMGEHAALAEGESIVAAYQRLRDDDELRAFFVTWAPWLANLTHHVASSEVYEGIRAMNAAGAAGIFTGPSA
jgi:hypothetical protein